MISAFLSESGLASGTVAGQREAMAEAVGSSPPPEGIAVEPLVLGGRPGERLVRDFPARWERWPARWDRRVARGELKGSRPCRS
ncbi:MAG: hypothetical protein ACRDYE_08850 [Acidimicrobiales bacterium]